MTYQYEEKSTINGVPVRVLADTYAPGRPEDKHDGRWRYKIGNRAEMLRYLRSAEGYQHEPADVIKRKETA